ncbi:MAG TPA: acyltransferase [Saprospiraceae bacterium]|nr:acyltransferase [Saprospiraceae bacterium]
MESIFIHPTAIVDAQVTMGEGSRIWHFCHIMSEARLGDRCVLGQNVFVGTGVQIGNGVKIQNNVSVYQGVVIEDDVFLGPSMVFTNVINPRSAIERKDAFKPTYVRKGATVGANATIICGIELGHHCFIGAGAVVTKDVLPYELWVGNPARRLGWMSERGMRLHFDINGRATCEESGEEYVLEDGMCEKVPFDKLRTRR